jgi:mono/diheme cytochrome c family protein
VLLVGGVALVQDRAIGQTAKQPAKAAPAATGADSAQKMINTYCVGCHNSRVKAGNLAFDTQDLKAAAQHGEVWEKALRKLRGNLMPPPGAPRPPQPTIDTFVSWMETTLDSNAKGPRAGYVPVQRLNRTEYAASVKSLLGVEVNEKDILPQDVQIEGFDNVASALTTSPAFLDQYIDAARRIAKKGVGDMKPPISVAVFQTAGNQDPAVPFPPGLRGAIKFSHDFPADGEYRFSFFDLDIGLYNRQMQNTTTLVLMIDGKSVFKGDLGGMADLRLANVKGTDGWQQILDRFQKKSFKVSAGKHEIIAGFIERSRVESDDNAGAGGGPGGGVPLAGFRREIDILEIKGPYNPTGISYSESRPLIFICDPKKSGEPACAKQIAENLARKAFRRPATPDDVTRLMKFYEQGRLDNGTFDQGITEVVAAVLASPEFLYRSIRGPKTAVKGTTFALTDLELATRLSFFLWNTGPDDELMKLAAANGLSKPGALDAQVKRMLADPKASSLVTSFAMKWLNLNSLDSVVPNAQIYQGFNAQLRKDFITEADRFLRSILLENRNVMELLTSDRTFVNNRLARHYGIQGPATSAFSEVTLTDSTRFGLLGKAAVLMRTSYGDRTSPVLRGAFVLDKLLGTPPTPPPPNVETDLGQPPGEAPKTVRARLELHRDKTSCNQCHGVIDPTGLALENFDSIGQFRKTDRQANNAPIDASTTMANGVTINGPAELRAQLTARPEVFVGALTEKLLMYSINRPLEYFDIPQVRKVVRDAKKDNYTLASLVLGIVKSDAFRKQGPATLLSKAEPKASPAKPAAPKPAAAKERSPLTVTR